MQPLTRLLFLSKLAYLALANKSDLITVPVLTDVFALTVRYHWLWICLGFPKTLRYRVFDASVVFENLRIAVQHSLSIMFLKELVDCFQDFNCPGFNFGVMLSSGLLSIPDSLRPLPVATQQPSSGQLRSDGPRRNSLPGTASRF